MHKKKKTLNIYLTGGKTSLLVYQNLKEKLINYNKKINFFLGDERFSKIKKNRKILLEVLI